MAGITLRALLGISPMQEAQETTAPASPRSSDRPRPDSGALQKDIADTRVG